MSKKQIPCGDENLICPMHKASCDTVCHKCPLWVQLRGTNPNTGEAVDEWMCSLGALPMLMIEAAQQARQGAAATESFRNEMVNFNTRAQLINQNTPRIVKQD